MWWGHSCSYFEGLLSTKCPYILCVQRKSKSSDVSQYVTVPGKRDQFSNFFQNRVIATAGKSRL